MPPSSPASSHERTLKKQRHAAAQKKYRLHKWAIPGLRYEVHSLAAKLSALTGHPVPLQAEPVRDTPPPGLSKKERDAFVAKALDRFHHATFMWLHAQKTLLLARIAEECVRGGGEKSVKPT